MVTNDSISLTFKAEVVRKIPAMLGVSNQTDVATPFQVCAMASSKSPPGMAMYFTAIGKKSYSQD